MAIVAMSFLFFTFPPLTCLVSSFARSSFVSHLPLSWSPMHPGVERIAQAVPQKVESQGRQHETYPGEDQKPPRDQVELVVHRVGDHPPPRGRGGRDPDAEVRER